MLLVRKKQEINVFSMVEFIFECRRGCSKIFASLLPCILEQIMSLPFFHISSKMFLNTKLQ